MADLAKRQIEQRGIELPGLEEQLEAAHSASVNAATSPNARRGGNAGARNPAPARGPSRLDAEQRDVLKRWRRHQKRYLPAGLAVLVTDAEAAALMALIRIANSEGRVCLSLTEWSSRAKAPESTMKAVRASLEGKELLGRRVGRRTGAYSNDQNNYYLLGEALKAVQTLALNRRDQASAEMTPQGAKVSPPKEESMIPDSKQLPPSAQDMPKPENRKNNQPLGDKSKAAPRGSAATSSICPPTTYALDLAKDACTEALPNSPAPRTVEEVWATVEAIRQSLMPTVNDGLWRWILRNRGWSAGLAVIETAILHRAGHVQSPAAYFWGIVKPTSDCAPAITVGKIMIHRRARGLANLQTKVRWPEPRAKQLSLGDVNHAA